MGLRSIRWQIQLWHGLVLILITAALLVGFYQYEKSALVFRLDAEMTGPLTNLLPQLIALPGMEHPPGVMQPDGAGANGHPGEPPRGGPQEGPRQLTEVLEERGFFVVVFTPDDEVRYRSAQAPANVANPNESGPLIFGRWNGRHRELVWISPFHDVVVLGTPAQKIRHGLGLFALQLGVIGASVVCIGIAGGHRIVGRAIRPLGEISQTAKRIAAGQWDERITSNAATAELSDLSAVLNTTFDRLSSAYNQQARFTADASHELGTPVSIVLSQTQMALSKPRAAAEYVEALEACRRAGERMRALTRALLELTDYDSGSATQRLVECDLAELVSEAIALVTPLAEERRALIVPQLQPASGRFNPMGISQALINLLNNAIKHSPEGVRVNLELSRHDASAQIVISDSGPGIAAEALPQIFERFYRAEKSRSRSAGGNGLGLAITKTIIEAHGGTIVAGNSPAGGGAVFTIQLPLRTK